MTATRLSIYNDALLLCGERALSTLTDNVESRYLLDQVWTNGGVQVCLEAGQWFFAMRTQKIDYSPSITPLFGYPTAFLKPADWVLTSALAADEFFRMPLTRYVDEAGYWYTDVQEIYVRFVSNDANYGNNLALWTQSFEEFVAAHFAWKVMLKLSADKEKVDSVFKTREKLKIEALNRSAMAEAEKFPAPGTWSISRQRGNNRRDRGNPGSLIG